MKKKLSIAIVGAGVMGGIHGKIAATSGAKIDYVVDFDAEKANKIAAIYGAKAVKSVAELAGKKVDLAFVCVPNNFHAKVSIELLNLKINVFCEKPLATKLADAQKMLAAAKANNKRLFVGHNRRFALRGIEMTSPDIRAGVALLIAALSARGTSRIHAIHQIDRGYEHIDQRLQAVGAQIIRT